MCLSVILNISLSLNFQCLHCNKKVPFCYIAIRAKIVGRKNRLNAKESGRFSTKTKKFKKVKKKGGQKGTFLFHSTVQKPCFVNIIPEKRHTAGGRCPVYRSAVNMPRRGFVAAHCGGKHFTVCDASHRCRDAWVPASGGMTMLWN